MTTTNPTKTVPVLLEIACATLKDTEVKVNVLLDKGSQGSYIRSSLAKKLGPAVEFVEMRINALDNCKPPSLYPKHEVALANGEANAINLSLIELQNIVDPLNTYRWKDGARKFHEYSVPQYEGETFEVDILIGADQLYKVHKSKVKKKKHLELRETLLGAVISGPLIRKKSERSTTSLTVQVQEEPPNFTKNFFSCCYNDVDNLFDNFLTELEKEAKTSKDTTSDIVKEFQGRVKFDQGRYQVPLLWNKDHPPLKSNLGLAKKWLESLTKEITTTRILYSYTTKKSRDS